MLFEDPCLVFGGDPAPLVTHDECDIIVASPFHPEENRARGRELDRIAEQIAQDARQQQAVRMHPYRDHVEFEPQALRDDPGFEFGCDGCRQFVDPEIGRSYRDIGGIELRDIEQRTEQIVERMVRSLDVGVQLALFRCREPFTERIEQQAHRVQRLAQIVTYGGEKTRTFATDARDGLFLAFRFGEQRLVFQAQYDRVTHNMRVIARDGHNEREVDEA